METKNRYGRVTGEVITQLTEIVGKRNVLTGAKRENYAWDETPHARPVVPEVVVKPTSTGEVARILKLASERNIPVTPRGGGTGLSGGAVPVYRGIVLSLKKMNKILEIDEDNFVVTVEPGVTLADLYHAVEDCDFYYPLYPGEKSATIGGNVATNAGGMMAVKYGVTRHFVLGLEAVLPTGEVIQTGGKFVKCSTGYDLTQLIVGSEGTLAVVTRIMLKLVNPPGRREILFVPFHSLKDAIGAVPDVLKEKILPVGIEFMERDIINMVEQYTGKEIYLHDYEAFLMMIVEADNDDDIYSISGHIGEICLEHGAVDVFIPGSERAKRNLLEAREKFYSVCGHYGLLDLADVVVPRSQIAEFVGRVREISDGYGLPVVIYGHAGDGNVHLHPLRSGSAEDKSKAKELFKKIYQLGISLGGTVSGEHGLGLAKKDYFSAVTDEPKLALMKRLKKAFDPNNIMNPGKVIDPE
ncbi:FAD-binding oxidoreductase [Chloroflexota bacterium]